MELPKNPRSTDGRWDTPGTAWRFRSPAEEKSFHDRVRRLKGADATSAEKVARAREGAAFEEDNRVRERMGIRGPPGARQAQNGGTLVNGLAITPEFMQEFRQLVQRYREKQGLAPSR
ncbi:MAG: hypothetical protein WCB10_17820 [Steroidobacteraceae bacterium]